MTVEVYVKIQNKQVMIIFIYEIINSMYLKYENYHYDIIIKFAYMNCNLCLIINIL